MDAKSLFPIARALASEYRLPMRRKCIWTAHAAFGGAKRFAADPLSNFKVNELPSHPDFYARPEGCLFGNANSLLVGPMQSLAAGNLNTDSICLVLRMPAAFITAKDCND